MNTKYDFIATERLRSSGLRITNPRISIFAYLLENLTHPTCDEIYSALKSDNDGLSFASVYNVTQKLTELGLINELVTPDGQKHYDGDTSFHGHFFCNRCSSIYDFPCPEDIYKKQLSKHKVENINIYAKGICDNCHK